MGTWILRGGREAVGGWLFINGSISGGNAIRDSHTPNETLYY